LFPLTFFFLIDPTIRSILGKAVDVNRRSVKNLIGLRAVPRLGLDQEEGSLCTTPLPLFAAPVSSLSLSLSLSLFLVTLSSPRPRGRRSIPGGDVLREHTLVEKSGRSVALITNNDDGVYAEADTRRHLLSLIRGVTTLARSFVRSFVLHEYV